MTTFDRKRRSLSGWSGSIIPIVSVFLIFQGCSDRRLGTYRAADTSEVSRLPKGQAYIGTAAGRVAATYDVQGESVFVRMSNQKAWKFQYDGSALVGNSLVSLFPVEQARPLQNQPSKPPTDPASARTSSTSGPKATSNDIELLEEYLAQKAAYDANRYQDQRYERVPQ